MFCNAEMFYVVKFINFFLLLHLDTKLQLGRISQHSDYKDIYTFSPTTCMAWFLHLDFQSLCGYLGAKSTA